MNSDTVSTVGLILGVLALVGGALWFLQQGKAAPAQPAQPVQPSSQVVIGSPGPSQEIAVEIPHPQWYYTNVGRMT